MTRKIKIYGFYSPKWVIWDVFERGWIDSQIDRREQFRSGEYDFTSLPELADFIAEERKYAKAMFDRFSAEVN